MPYVNHAGRIAHGRAGSGAFLDNVAIDSGGDACWFTEDRVLYQHGGADGWYLQFYDPATGEKTRADDRGANTLAAGGGVWAAFLNGQGVYASTGLALPEAALLAVGPDGAIGYKPQYHGDGGGRVREVDGRDWFLTDDAVMELHLVGAQRAVWRTVGAELRIAGLPMPAMVPGPIYSPRAVEIAGDWWIAYYADAIKRLVFHPFASTVGYDIASGDTWPDVTLLAGTSSTARVVWSTTLGEIAGDVHHRDIDVATEPRHELVSELPPDPPDPPDPPEPVPDAPQITIRSYDMQGPAPMACHAQAELSGGPAEAITWLLNDAAIAMTDPTELEYVYQFDAPGSYAIGVAVTGPGGSDQTGSPRLVTVTDPNPPDPPDPTPIPGGNVTPIQLSEPAYVNWRYGGGQSLDPPTNPDDPNRDAFEYGRTVAGSDETAQLVQLSDGTYGIKSPNGKTWLSIQGDGSYQERACTEGQEPGPWERFTLKGNILTELSKGENYYRAPVEFVQP